MPVWNGSRLILMACLLAAIGCQSTAPDTWKFWKSSEYADRTRGLKDPERTHLAYAQLQEQSGQLQNARESYEIALEQNGHSTDAVLGLARLDLLGGRSAEAERRFHQALEMAPNDPHVLDAVGQFYLSQDNYTEAMRHLSRAVEADPLDRKVRHRLGLALARSGDVRAAETQFVQTVGEAESDYNIGLILYEAGRTDEAEQRFANAVAKKPTLTQAQEWLNDLREERKFAQTPPQLTAPAVAQQTSSIPAVTGTTLPPQAVPGMSSPMPLTPLPSIENLITSAGQPAGVQQHSTAPRMLVPASMNATQLEQWENSLPPAERERLRNELRTGQLPLQSPRF